MVVDFSYLNHFDAFVIVYKQSQLRAKLKVKGADGPLSYGLQGTIFLNIQKMKIICLAISAFCLAV